MTVFSIIIPTYKDWDRLRQCVNQILRSKKENLLYEVIIVDNDKNHEPPMDLQNNDQLKLIHEPRPGSYAARNCGAKEALGKYLAFTDSDCLPDESWLTNALDIFQNTPVDLIGGRIDLFKTENGSDWAYIYEKHTAFAQEKNVPKGHSVTANLLVKRDVFEALGGFNDKIKSGGDWEFSRRAVDSGYRLVYADKVRVQHPARKSVGAIFKKQKRFAAWGYLNVKNEYGHSGLRITMSHAYHGIGSVFRRSSIPESTYEKGVLFLISSGLYGYKLLLHLLILFKLINPEKIRE